MIAVVLLGFASGLPLSLTASTLGAWLTKAGVSMTNIGLFAAVATPYTLKFLWSPLVDGLSLPLLRRFGRRRGWLIGIELALMLAIAGLGLTHPDVNPWPTAAMALLVAFLSASQDTVIDAYRVEILKPEEQGAGAAAVVLGYMLGFKIVSGAGALILAAHISWAATYAIMAALISVGTAAAFWIGEPQAESTPVQQERDTVAWLRAHVVAPFIDFMTRPQWLTVLLFILLYKLADAFMGVMTNPFLIKIGFSLTQIALVVKFYGFAATILGSFIGGALVARWGVVRSLWVCGVAHAVTNLMFVVQAHIGPDPHFLALSISLENISGGMGTAAFVAYISGLTNLRFTATQYALLSSLSAFGRTWLSTPAGWCAQILGWAGFFTLAALLAIPGLMVLWRLQRAMPGALPVEEQSKAA